MVTKPAVTNEVTKENGCATWVRKTHSSWYRITPSDEHVRPIMRPLNLCLVLFLSLPSLAFAKVPLVKISCGQTKGLNVEAEMQWTDIALINVTFIEKMPTNAQAKTALYDCLKVAIARDASKDILATPWFKKRRMQSDNDDDMLHPFGGTRYLSFSASTGKTAVHELQLKRK